MNRVFQNRKILYLILGIVLVSVFSLTVVYAALSVTLNITGSAEVSAANWDIRFENVDVSAGSVSGAAPTIASNTTASFTTTLTNPGDYYMFTIDVVNRGSIDAMIDSVTKSPTLTSDQAKYLNYVIEYENGESISTKQVVDAGAFVRLKVKVEYRKDINAYDLPSSSTTLNLSFKVNYIQADDSGNDVSNGGVFNNPVRLVNGSVDTLGSDVCIGDECFQVIASDNNSVTLFSKNNITLDDSPRQSEESFPAIFSSTNYWSTDVSSYPAYVYDQNSFLYEHVENYRDYLISFGIVINEARLISLEEFYNITECDDALVFCYFNYDIVEEISFWIGTAKSNTDVYYLYDDSSFGYDAHYIDYDFGIRPVIVISKEYF